MNEDIRHSLDYSTKHVPITVKLTNRNAQTAAKLCRLSPQRDLPTNLVLNFANFA
jgi:hypothetical protein